MNSKEDFLAEEAIIVRNSGEIPEIAFHGSIYYLSEDPDGPQLELNEHDFALLRSQAVARYCEIILRDLTPENRDKSIYRGIRRSICNWERLGKFCQRQDIALEKRLRQEFGKALGSFLRQEEAEVREGLRASCLNCTEAELRRFALDLGLTPAELPGGLACLCQQKEAPAPVIFSPRPDASS
ncbi:hypothetical protein ACUUL3_14035 [Thiovibrio sp. JS02]